MKLWLELLTLSFSSWALGKVNPDPTYTNRWAVKIQGGAEVAQSVARQLGYSYKGQLGKLEDYYELKMDDHPEVSKRDSDHLTRSLLDFDEVKWARQQTLSRHVFKNINIPKEKEDDDVYIQHNEDELKQFMKHQEKSVSDDPQFKNNMFSCLPFSFGFRRLFAPNISNLGKFPTTPAPHSQLSKYRGSTKNIQLLSNKISAYEVYFNDPLWKKQWYVQDYRTTDIPVMDHNVVPVYKMGITGLGITVAIVDTQVQINHPDLKANIDIDKSYDVCRNKRMRELMYDIRVDNDHGTKAAGIVAMTANNSICGAGIAYNAKVAAYVVHGTKTRGFEVRKRVVNHVANNWHRFQHYTLKPSEDVYNIKDDNVAEMGQFKTFNAESKIFPYELQVYEEGTFLGESFGEPAKEIDTLIFSFLSTLLYLIVPFSLL